MLRSSSTPTRRGDDAAFDQPFERQFEGAQFEGADEGGGTRVSVSRKRELYCGPMSWLMGVCIFGPFVMLCPCDGREVYLADEAYDEVKGVPEAHVDDTYDQEGILLKPLSAAQQPGGEGVTGSIEADVPAGSDAPDTGHSRDEASALPPTPE